MSKYDLYFTKEDARKAYIEIERLEKALDMPMDWKKVKRMNGDNIATVIGILQRKEREQFATDDVVYIDRYNMRDFTTNEHVVEAIEKALGNWAVIIAVKESLVGEYFCCGMNKNDFNHFRKLN